MGASSPPAHVTADGRRGREAAAGGRDARPGEAAEPRIRSPGAHDRDRHGTRRQRRAGAGADARARVHHLPGDEGQRARGVGRRRDPPPGRRPPARRAQGRGHRRDPRPDGPRARALHPPHRRAGGAHRAEDHRRHRPVHVQRGAALLGGARPRQWSERHRPDGRAVREGHHRGHRRHRRQGRRDQVRHRSSRRHARRGAGAAGVRPDPPSHRRADHDAHVRRRLGAGSSSRRSSRRRAST